MRNPLPVVVALVALPLVGRAGETAVRLKVAPMPAPNPALRYLLLPEVRELKPGNPVQWYVRCFAEQRTFFFNKQSVAMRERYRSAPLAELAAEKLGGYGRFALDQADWGARMDAPDWNVTERLSAEGMDLVLPELRTLRVLAEALQARFRIAVAERRYDDAVRTAKTMFALARHLAECPTLPASLLGLSTAELALDTLQEMIQQPGSPNLYWALTDLPVPLVGVRQGLQGDRARVDAELRSIRGDATMRDDEVEKVVGRLSGLLGYAREQAGRPPWSLRAGLAARLKDAEKVRLTRARMVEVGRAEAALKSFLLVQTFPDAQVVLLDEKHRFEARRDEDLKLLGLAPWQIDAQESKGGEANLFADLLPHVAEARRAQGRLEQRIALLRCVEALRLYAAGHEGRLPEKLADCPVPIPDDPFTGKPFAYKRDGGASRLARYEITIRK